MSNVKEPYVISVWEEELIPAQDWYVKAEGDSKITVEQYNQLNEEDKKDYKLYTIMEHFEEVQGVIIGSDDMDSAFSVIQPIFKENVNGSVELTFGLYYKVFDPEIMDFSPNPYVPMLTNEAKIKFKFRDNWYDLVVKNCVEDSTNNLFTYTCKDFYINELNKNGFKVQLDSELENNQGSVIELGKTILKDTDWKIDEEKTDVIVETKIEPLYIGIPRYDLKIERVSDYIPDVNIENVEEVYPSEWVIRASDDLPILLFYSEVTEKKKEPQILAVFENGKYLNPAEKEIENKYLLDINNDVITNGCNYRILGYFEKGDDEGQKPREVRYSESATKNSIMNIIGSSGLNIYDRARAEKVVRSQKTGYDPDMDKHISKYYKIVDGEVDTEVEYYGYDEEQILRTDLAENLLANSEEFVSTDTGWVFDGVPEKRTKGKETGYVGQIFQKSSIIEDEFEYKTNPDETILELNLKPRNEPRYYQDDQGEFYFITYTDKDGRKQKDYFSEKQEPERIQNYKENVSDSYRKLREAGTTGYADKTDAELNNMIGEYLSSIRYSKGQRLAINTGVAANRNKIKQLSPGEEYVFAVSLGKFKEGETPPKINDEIQYGVKVPDRYYDFIEVDGDCEMAYNAAQEAINKLGKELLNDPIKNYLQNPDYQGRYNEEYNKKYEELKQAYKERYLRTNAISSETTKENWQPGGRRKSGLHGLWGEWIGYYEIFLNVLRGFKEGEGESEEEYRYPSFLVELDNALACIEQDNTKGRVTEEVYKAFIGETEVDKDGKIHYSGIYPEMVEKTIEYSTEKRKDQLFSKQSAYDPMGQDKKLYPEYDENTGTLVPMVNSFSEFLFAQFYQKVIDKWLVPDGTNANWNYKKDYEIEGKSEEERISLRRDALSTLLKSTYKSCYENTNTIFEVWDYTEKYHMPSATNQSGGEYYQIHEADWVKKSHATATEIISKEAEKGLFTPPFKYKKEGEEDSEDNIAAREAFIKIFSGGSYTINENNEKEYPKEKEKPNMADYCYEKEQSWLSTKSVDELQSDEFIKQLQQARKTWVDKYLQETKTEDNFGGAWYCVLLLGKYYTQLTYEKETGTYTYNTDNYELNLVNNTKAPGQLKTYIPQDIDEELEKLEKKYANNKGSTEYIRQKNRLLDDKKRTTVYWMPETYYTAPEGATHYAVVVDEEKPEEEKTGGYVFDKVTKQIRLFDPYKDALNATFIPEKDDEGGYVFDPTIWKYRPYRDWDKDEYRDPITLEINKESGVPGDKVYHPLKLFDGRFGSWYDIPTRYNMVRKYENPDDQTKYKYLSERKVFKEIGHCNGQDVPYQITYPIGYQYDVYVKNNKGKYIKESNLSEKKRFLGITIDASAGTVFSWQGQNFFSIISEGIQGFFDRFVNAFKNLFDKPEDMKEIDEAYTTTSDEDANKGDAGIAISNAENQNDDYYDEDRASINFYSAIEDNNETLIGFGNIILDDVANASEVANAQKANTIEEQSDYAEKIQEAERFIKYKSYYWRHWGKQRYDYQPKICIQQTIDGIKVYKPYNNVEDKKSESYNIVTIERDDAGNPTNIPNDVASDEIVFLKNRKTTYRQRVETDYEAFKYRMKKVDDMNESYWIEAPNGENYLRHYKSGDGKIQAKDGHFWKWVQCYSAFKVASDDVIDPAVADSYLDQFYMPYDNIMIPYNHRIFNATKQLTRIPKNDYQGIQDNDDTYVKYNDIYMTLTQYYEEVGYQSKLNYNDLKVSFINGYDYKSDVFAISVEQSQDGFLEFDLNKSYNTIDLIVEKDPLTSEVTKERWIYWIEPVTKGFSLIENPLSKLGMLFETTKEIPPETEEQTEDKQVSNEEGRYVFLGMKLFKHIPYETSSKEIEYEEYLLEELDETNKTYFAKAIQETYEEYVIETFKLFEKETSDSSTSEEIAKLTNDLNSTETFISNQLVVQIDFNANNGKINFIIKKDNEVITNKEKIENYIGKAILEFDNNKVDEIITMFRERLQHSQDEIAFLNTAPSLYENNITVLTDVDSNGENILRFQIIKKAEKVIIPLFPGEAPDAAELHFKNYYIYDPDIVEHPDSAIFEYVGRDYIDKFVPSYDNSCQKIRSIKGKESNYYKLLQDCCDTFDCWMQKEVQHDLISGQIKYCDVPIYTETVESIKNNSEPQVFVGEEALLAGTLDAARKIHHKLFGKIRVKSLETNKENTETENTNENKDSQEIPDDQKFHEYCEYVALDDVKLNEKEQKLLLRLNRINNLHFKVEYMRVPDKRISFKRFVGEERWNGFKYGVNLKHIKRTIDSSQFSTRIIVKQNSNQFGKDGMCSIARAKENPIKENFILDFSYYVNNGLLDNSDLIGDLYTDTNTRLSYYPKLANLNNSRDKLITKQSSLLISLDNVKSKYDTAVLLKDVALEEITKLGQLLTANYDTYGQIISIPWVYNKSSEYTLTRQTSAPGTTMEIKDTYGEEEYSFEIKVPETTTVAEYPKYNDTLRSYLDQMDVYQREYAKNSQLVAELEPEKERLEAEIAEISAYLEEIASKINELNKLFYHKYSRFIQEGSWVDETYLDDDLYYLDALSVSRISAKPKITYDIGVVDVSAAYEYEEDKIVLESHIGDRTYIEDVEFFGYNKNDSTKPYWEMVVVTEKTYNIDDPSQNQIKVKNYTTQFDDLFQRIAATSQSLQFNEGSYARSSQLLNANGTLNLKYYSKVLQIVILLFQMQLMKMLKWIKQELQ